MNPWTPKGVNLARKKKLITISEFCAVIVIAASIGGTYVLCSGILRGF